MAVQAFGADLLGFVFAESKRNISVKKAQEIARQVPGLGKVGVFVNAPLTEVREIAHICRLDYIQLHGEETPEYCRQAGYSVIKAFRVKQGFDLAACSGYQPAWTLFDTFSTCQHGGTGVAFDWQQARGLLSRAPKPWLVAGGLTPDNVAEAISLFRPDGVDVSGGVETNGVKDIAKMKRFITAVRKTEVIHAS